MIKLVKKMIAVALQACIPQPFVGVSSAFSLQRNNRGFSNLT
ncbi:MAG: hypothetical protein N3E45_11050 [Oscillatoriaceae bacterium SKW80]|nr:hypothetical protein [Oscillatoriaceae bacterium SKW80]